jgi:hypothetical protein
MKIISQNGERASEADLYLQSLLNEGDVALITGLLVASGKLWRLTCGNTQPAGAHQEVAR